MKNKNIIVISAAQFEVMPLLEVLEEHNISAKHIEIGIGPINAAANRSLLDLKKKESCLLEPAVNLVSRSIQILRLI